VASTERPPVLVVDDDEVILSAVQYFLMDEGYAVVVAANKIDSIGDLYVGDRGNSVIRKVTTAGVVTTICGSNTGVIDGSGASAGFGSLLGWMTIDPNNLMYVTDENTVRTVTEAGVAAALASLGAELATPLPSFTFAEAMARFGTDRPDVRFDAHLDRPEGPEAFYQPIGRAGGDGERAETLLLYGGQEIAVARHRLNQSAQPEWQKRTMRAKLDEMVAFSETVECRTRTLLACFNEALEAPCGHCDTCDAPPSTLPAVVEAQKALSAVHRTGQMFGALHVIAASGSAGEYQCSMSRARGGGGHTGDWGNFDVFIVRCKCPG